MNKVDVCFSPALFDTVRVDDGCVVVVTDILRATTSMCTAFDYGVKEIIPVSSVEIAMEYKNNGWLVASEKDCVKSDFADYGNSAFYFMNDDVRGKTIVYNTTNGTVAINMARRKTNIVAIGAFINFIVLKNWIVSIGRDVLIFCSGWRNSFCLEDSIFAGAMADVLIGENGFVSASDSVCAARDLWGIAKGDIMGYIEKTDHNKRLDSMGLGDVVPYSFCMDVSKSVPVLKGDGLVNVVL